MATIQTIATTLTNDHRPAVASLRAFDGEVDRTFQRLDARTRRMGAQMAAGLNRGGPGGRGGNLASGFLEASRAIEDASVGFQLNGLQGAVRGAGNNISQLALTLGGPLVGAIAGLTVAALPSLVSWLTKSKDAARDFGKEIDFAMERLEKSQKAVEQQVGFRQMVRGLDSPEAAADAMRKRVDEIEILNNKINDIEGVRRRNGNQFKIQNPQLFDPAEVEAAEQADRRMFLQGLEHMRERKRLEEEINEIKKKRVELDKTQIQKDQEAFAALIRGFQEEDERQQARDNERLQALLNGRLQGLGVKADPLEGMDIPEDLRGRISGLLGEADALNSRRGSRLAQVAMADSQSLLLVQAQAKEAAEAKKQRDSVIKRLDDLLRELKGARRDAQQDGDVDVNLN